jgi:hypothetical protein
MAKKAASSATKSVVANKVTKDMTPELAKEFKIISDKLNDLDQKNILSRYEVGEHIAKIKETDTKFGEGAVEKVAAAMNRQADELYALARIVETYTREEIEQMLEKGAKKGFQVTYSHVRLLAGVSDKRVRTKAATEMVKAKATVVETRAIIHDLSHTDGDVEEGAARKKSFKMYLKSTLKESAKMRKVLEDIQEGLPADGKLDIRGKALDEIEKFVEDTLEGLKDLPDSITTCLASLGDIRERLLLAQEEGEEEVDLQDDEEEEEVAYEEAEDGELEEDDFDDEYDEESDSEDEFEEEDDEFEEEDDDFEEEVAPKKKTATKAPKAAKATKKKASK